jgi:hypothetical protein
MIERSYYPLESRIIRERPLLMSHTNQMPFDFRFDRLTGIPVSSESLRRWVAPPMSVGFPRCRCPSQSDRTHYRLFIFFVCAVSCALSRPALIRHYFGDDRTLAFTLLFEDDIEDATILTDGWVWRFLSHRHFHSQYTIVRSKSCGCTNWKMKDSICNFSAGYF